MSIRSKLAGIVCGHNGSNCERYVALADRDRVRDSAHIHRLQRELVEQTLKTMDLEDVIAGLEADLYEARHAKARA